MIWKMPLSLMLNQDYYLMVICSQHFTDDEAKGILKQNLIVNVLEVGEVMINLRRDGNLYSMSTCLAVFVK